MLKPVLVRAFGRTGTTLMMQILKASDGVFVPNKYPFESRFLSYFARMAKMPFSESNNYPEGFVWNDEKINTATPLLGCVPYNIDAYCNRDRLASRFLLGLWNQFSEEVKMETGEVYEYYAEKVSLPLSPFIASTINNQKSIYIVRDPRGELASVYSFNQKRGFNGFGWLPDDTLETYARRMVKSRALFFRAVSAYWGEGNNNNIVFRYEDLATELEVQTRRLSEFLGVSVDVDLLKATVGDYGFHMTNDSAGGSVDAWKSKLPEDIANIFTSQMGDELALYGYMGDAF